MDNASINICGFTLELANILSPNDLELFNRDPFLTSHFPSGVQNEFSLTNLEEMRFQKITQGGDLMSLPFILLSSIGDILARRRMFMIHGSGLIKNNHLIILVGPPGSGKSSVASMLLLKGYKLIGDDRLVFDMNMQPRYGNRTLGVRDATMIPEIENVLQTQCQKSQFSRKSYFRLGHFEGGGKIKKISFFKVRINHSLNHYPISIVEATVQVFRDVLTFYYGAEAFSTSQINIWREVVPDQEYLIDVLKSLKKNFANADRFFIEGSVMEITDFIMNLTK